MIKKTLLLCFFMSFMISYAQEKEDDPLSNSSYITFDLFTPVDVYTPRWRVGYIQGINPHWKFGAKLGYGNNALAIASESNVTNEWRGEDYQIWEVRPEVYYILSPTHRVKKYLSAEAFYIHHTDTFLNSLYKPGGDENISIEFDSADFFRQKYGVNFKFGLFIDIIKRFGINVYAGAGFRIRDNEFSNVINPSLVLSDNLDEDIFDIDDFKENEGTDFGVNLSLGVQFVFKID